MRRKNRPAAHPLRSLGLLVLGLLGLGAAQAEPQANIQYRGPLVITRGGTYTGNWQSLDVDTPAVTIKTSEPVVIENSNIRSKSTLILSRYVGANVTVRNTRGIGVNPGLPANKQRSPGRFIKLENFKNVLVYNNELIGTGGMYFYKYEGDPSRGQTVKILRNRARNIDGRFSAGPDRFADKGYWIVHFVQFNDVKGIPGAEIAWNEVINEPGKSRMEEGINMYLSRGTPKSYISIHDNYIQGAYPTNPASDKYGGGGIMVGDGWSRSSGGVSAYVRAERNQVVSTSNQGIGITGGHNIEANDNRVISSGLLPDGTPIASQNVGIYVWDMNRLGQKYQAFFKNSMQNNVVAWARPQQSPTAQNAFWFPDCSYCAGNRRLSGPVTLAMEEQEYRRWQAKLKNAKVALGPQ